MLSTPAPAASAAMVVPAEGAGVSRANHFLRALFVALAVGLAWGIRGDFGHVLGASYPGAILGLAFIFVLGDTGRFRYMPVVAACSALGIATGGTMSYGVLHGYAQADTLPNYAYGFLTLFLQGGAWGTFGCGMIGLLLAQRRPSLVSWAIAIAALIIGGKLFAWLVVDQLGFHVNPGRSNGSIARTGSALAWFAWLALSRHTLGLRAALLGYLGFGSGMALGRLLANVMQNQPFPINHWNVMEVSVGLIGGFVFTWGMLRHVPAAEQLIGPTEAMGRGQSLDAWITRGFAFISAVGIVYVVGLIPLLHRLWRVRPDRKLTEWGEALSGYGYADPAHLAQINLWAINGVCVLAAAGAGGWLWLHFKDRARGAWFPVFALSAAMLLIQNLNALYPYYPRVPGSINMHFVFWVLMAGMIVVAGWIQGRAGVASISATTIDKASAPVPWLRWLAMACLLYGLIVLAAGFVNGPQTMRSACTRWPRWEWKDGPFPR